MGDALIRFEAVTKTYTKGTLETQALRGLDLTIQKGEFVALWGPSGSGKTTALNLIGALDVPSSGRISVEGKELGRLSRAELQEGDLVFFRTR
ncbi:MAG TPA: ATP-binding cassette domain-containing protein, partial [Myxococcota bacterium]|nr:ATP-binding cassette domain-containing protein [Myxococcota bacterium]